MTPALLDINVIIALLDPTHEHHDAAHDWFFAVESRPWMTSPTIENGVIRIMSHPRYPNNQSVATVMHSMDTLISLPGHSRISDDESLLSGEIDRDRLLSSAQITDTFLILLAHRRNAQLATFDRRISAQAVRGASATVLQVPTN